MILESFDATNDLNGAKWFSAQGPVVTGGRFGGNCLQNGTLTYRFPAVTALNMGFAFKIPPAVPFPAFAIAFTNNGTTIGSITISRLGILTFTMAGVVLTAPKVVTANTWNYVEISTAPTIVLYLNGVAGASSTSSTGPFNEIVFNAPNSLFDDVIINPGGGTTGGQVLNCAAIAALKPIAAGNTTQFASGTGNPNYQNVAEFSPDATTTYNVSSSTNSFDLFQFSQLPSNTSSVLAAQFMVMALKTPLGTQGVCNLLFIGSSFARPNNAIHALSTTFEYKIDCITINPTTGVAWTPSVINSMQIGYQMINPPTTV